MKLGYLGPIGSFTYEAAVVYSERFGSDVKLVAMSSFADIIDGVEAGAVDGGMLPVENSTYGAVATAMDLLLGLQKTTVCGEYVLNIEHCLLSSGNSADEIRYVYSHEQALEQCRNFFRREHPRIELVSCTSTSQACKLALAGGDYHGAVASVKAADMYSLNVLAENIQDNPCNQTRFLYIGKAASHITGNDKTSIAFAFSEDHAGCLYGVFKIFAEMNINLTRVESRPAKQIVGEYIFFIDFIGHQDQPEIKAVLTAIQEQTAWVKVFGSYPQA